MPTRSSAYQVLPLDLGIEKITTSKINEDVSPIFFNFLYINKRKTLCTSYIVYYFLTMTEQA